MTITMSKRDYSFTDIDQIHNGAMCMILHLHNNTTGTDRYLISTDVIHGGWIGPEGRSFHGTTYDVDAESTCTGLGTFILISDTETESGDHILEFTDDLNPDLP